MFLRMRTKGIMKNSCADMPNGYLETINKGMSAVRYLFWQMTLANDRAIYACLNYGEAFCPGEIDGRSICIDGDIGTLLTEINSK